MVALTLVVHLTDGAANPAVTAVPLERLHPIEIDSTRGDWRPARGDE